MENEYFGCDSPQVNVQDDDVYICYKDLRSNICSDEGYSPLNSVCAIYAQKLSVQTSISNEEEVSIPEIEISNYPNPFYLCGIDRSSITTIKYSLPKNIKEANIEIYNIKGQCVNILEIEPLDQKNNHTTWNGIDNNNILVGSGIYFYKLSANGKCFATKKMLLLK